MNRVAGLILVGVWMTAGLAAAEPQVREFGAATFTAPTGFDLDGRPTVQRYVRIRGRDLCMILIYADEASPSGLGPAFTDAWTAVFNESSYRRADLPAMREQTSPTGYRYASGEGDLEDRGGNRYVARLHVFPVGTRAQTVALMGNSRAALDGCRPEWEAFFSSLEFPTMKVEKARGGPQKAVVRGDVTTPTERDGPIAANPPPGSPQRFDNFNFTPPAGWRVLWADDAVTLTPAVTQPGETLQVLLLQGRKAAGPLDQEFMPAWREVLALYRAQPMTTVNGGAYDLDEPGRSIRGWEYLRGNGGMILGDGNYNVDLYLIRAGDRTERVLVLARDFRANLMTINASMNPVHARAIRRFIFTLSFVGQPPIPVAPAAITRATSGVWGGSSLSFGSLKATFAILFDDGTAFFGPNFPTEGLEGIDPSAEQPAAPRYWGKYTVTGDRGEIRMPYGTIPFRLSGTALEVTTSGTAHKFARLSMPDGNQLEGTWCLSDGACLQLGPSGRFRDSGAVRILEHATYDFPESPEAGEGTYLIKNHSLILRYSNGREFRLAFPGLVGGASSSPSQLMLSFNLDVLTRR